MLLNFLLRSFLSEIFGDPFHQTKKGETNKTVFQCICGPFKKKFDDIMFQALKIWPKPNPDIQISGSISDAHRICESQIRVKSSSLMLRLTYDCMVFLFDPAPFAQFCRDPGVRLAPREASKASW